MAKGSKIVRNILLFLNFIYLVAGLACIVLGLLVLLDKPRLNPLLNLDTGGTTLGIITASAILIICVGVVTVIFAILGCCGAARESRILLSVYIGLLVLLLILELSGGVLAAHYRTETEINIKGWMVEQLKGDYDGRGDSTREFTRNFDFAQVEFDCCGINNYSDFSLLAANWTERTSRSIPIACCKLNKTEFYNRNLFIVNSRSCTTAPTTAISNIHQPCFEKIREHLMTQALYLLLIAFLLIIVKFLGIVFACCHIRNIRDIRG